MKQFMMLCVAVSCLVATPPVWGKEDRSKQRPASILDTMVVTAGRVEENKADVSTNLTVLDGEFIRNSGARNLGDLMASQGFMIREYPNSQISVSIRGFSTEPHGNDLASHVLILIDGRRAGTGNLAKISVDNIQRIEIIRGPGSVQYGASAMGGIVNVITQKGQDEPTVSAEGMLGSWDYEKFAIDGSGKIGEFDFSFNASAESQDEYDTAEGIRYANTGYDGKDRFGVTAGWTFAPANRIGISYTSYQGEGIGSPNRLSSNDPDNYVDNALRSFDLVYDGKTTDAGWIWKIRYFKGKDEYETFDPENYGDIHDYFRNTDQEGAQAQLTANWDQIRFTSGIDWTRYAIVNSSTEEGKENTYENPALFALGKAFLLDGRLVFSIGARYDHYEVINDRDVSTRESNWSTSAGAVVAISENMSARINYAEAFRMPTTNELYMFRDYSAWGFGIFSGNPDLAPEKSKTIEAGVDFAVGTMMIGLSAFTTDFDNKISYFYSAATNTTRYENVDGAEISGFEGSVQMDVAPWFGWSGELTPYASFTYLATYEDKGTGDHLKDTPDWTAAYGIRLTDRSHGLSGGINASTVGEQTINDYEGTGATSLERHTVVDLTVAKRLVDFNSFGDISVRAVISNLFDEDYALVQGYPMPGRTFYIGLKYTY